MRKIYLFAVLAFSNLSDFCYSKNIKLTFAWRNQTRYTNITFDQTKKEIYAIYNGIKTPYYYPP